MNESYVYDATNRMVKGTNDIGETSEYVYDGLGDLVRNIWTVKKGAYGYTGITTQQVEASVGDILVIADPNPSTTKNKKDRTLAPGQQGGGSIKASGITKDYVLDYTSPLRNVIMESETLKSENGKDSPGLTYRFVCGVDRLSVRISPVTTGGGGIVQNGAVKLWYHQDRLGSTDFLTDNVQGKVASYIDYDAWGAPLKKAVLKLDARELDMAIGYTGHPYDPVLGVYYAKARMYDASDRRFMAPDPVRGDVKDPKTLTRYVYCVDNPLVYVDPDGLIRAGKSGSKLLKRTLNAWPIIDINYKKDFSGSIDTLFQIVEDLGFSVNYNPKPVTIIDAYILAHKIKISYSVGVPIKKENGSYYVKLVCEGWSSKASINANGFVVKADGSISMGTGGTTVVFNENWELSTSVKKGNWTTQVTGTINPNTSIIALKAISTFTDKEIGTFASITVEITIEPPASTIEYLVASGLVVYGATTAVGEAAVSEIVTEVGEIFPSFGKVITTMF